MFLEMIPHKRVVVEYPELWQEILDKKRKYPKSYRNLSKCDNCGRLFLSSKKHAQACDQSCGGYVKKSGKASYTPDEAVQTFYSWRRNIDLKRPPCQKCGDSNSEAHHQDYTKPFSIIWLCKSCHQYAHGCTYPDYLKDIKPIEYNRTERIRHG
jgi:ribosomal protein S27AE